MPRRCNNPIQTTCTGSDPEETNRFKRESTNGQQAKEQKETCAARVLSARTAGEPIDVMREEDDAPCDVRAMPPNDFVENS